VASSFHVMPLMDPTKDRQQRQLPGRSNARHQQQAKEE